jgi:hypothetical protein
VKSWIWRTDGNNDDGEGGKLVVNVREGDPVMAVLSGGPCAGTRLVLSKPLPHLIVPVYNPDSYLADRIRKAEYRLRMDMGYPGRRDDGYLEYIFMSML